MLLTKNNLKLAFASIGNDVLDVRHFEVTEAMDELWELKILATSTDDNIDFDKVVGKGAALKVDTREHIVGLTVRSWAGVVSDITDRVLLQREVAHVKHCAK